jgi:Phosphoribosyl-ATP pyrophosphohydrolase
MTEATDAVREFHRAFGFHISDVPAVPPEDIRVERARLIAEEAAEAICEILSGHPGAYDVFLTLCEIFRDRARPHDRRPLPAKVAGELGDGYSVEVFELRSTDAPPSQAGSG